MTQQLQLHPLCTLFPRLVGAELAMLRDDIKANGLREPIVIHQGLILDGGNRYQACLDAGVEPAFKEFTGDDLVSFVLSANLHRRHMTPGQQAAIVSTAQDWSRTFGHGGDRKSDQVLTRALGTVEQRAAQSGASVATQRRADAVAKADPELAKQVARGNVSLTQAVQQVAPQLGPRRAAPDAADLPELDDEPDAALPDPEPEDHMPTAVELLEQADEERRSAEARVAVLEAAMNADDTKAQLLVAIKRADHASRRQAELMQDAAASQKRAEFYERQLARCGKAVGVRDIDQIAAAVEALARRAKVAA